MKLCDPWKLATLALAFMGVFGFLAARFNYPAVLDGSAQEVFSQLLALLFAGMASISMMLGLMRWPSIARPSA